MKLTRTYQFNPALVNVVPLINVIFLVVVFYALSSRFILQPGLPVVLPKSSFTLAPQPEPQIVSIISAPVPAIYFENGKVTIEEFAARLATRRAEGRSLIIKADAAVPYEMVMQVMNEGLLQGFPVVLAATPSRP